MSHSRSSKLKLGISGPKHEIPPICRCSAFSEFWTRADGYKVGFRPLGRPTSTVCKTATEYLPHVVLYPHDRRVYRLLHQPMNPALRPHAHCMEHEVADVGLLSLVHHDVMLVNVEDVRR